MQEEIGRKELLTNFRIQVLIFLVDVKNRYCRYPFIGNFKVIKL